jgi:hypothetical protein
MVICFRLKETVPRRAGKGLGMKRISQGIFVCQFNSSRP